MIDAKRLQDKAEQALTLNTNSIEKLNYYAELLVEYNKKVNLTAIVEPREIEDKHFMDCLHLAAQPFVLGKVCDVGSGAGFPGIVLAIVKPEIRLTLLEPTLKRCKFLELICRELDIDANIVNRRAEEVGRGDMREVFDLVTARAVASLPILLEYCLPLSCVGGGFVAMKGEAENLTDGKKAARLLGADKGSDIHYTLPEGEFRRLIHYKKISPTSKAYPRNGGVISKRPLL